MEWTPPVHHELDLSRNPYLSGTQGPSAPPLERASAARTEPARSDKRYSPSRFHPEASPAAPAAAAQHVRLDPEMDKVLSVSDLVGQDVTAEDEAEAEEIWQAGIDRDVEAILKAHRRGRRAKETTASAIKRLSVAPIRAGEPPAPFVVYGSANTNPLSDDNKLRTFNARVKSKKEVYATTIRANKARRQRARELEESAVADLANGRSHALNDSSSSRSRSRSASPAREHSRPRARKPKPAFCAYGNGSQRAIGDGPILQSFNMNARTVAANGIKPPYPPVPESTIVAATARKAMKEAAHREQRERRESCGAGEDQSRSGSPPRGGSPPPGATEYRSRYHHAATGSPGPAKAPHQASRPAQGVFRTAVPEPKPYRDERFHGFSDKLGVAPATPPVKPYAKPFTNVVVLEPTPHRIHESYVPEQFRPASPLSEVVRATYFHHPPGTFLPVNLIHHVPTAGRPSFVNGRETVRDLLQVFD